MYPGNGMATILDRIKWEIEAPLPQFNDVLALQQKCNIFSIIEMGEAWS